MVEQLNDYLDQHPCKGFDPKPFYSKAGDFVSFTFRNERAFEKRIDNLLTVYLSVENKELVGCKIKGVRKLLAQFRSFHLTLQDSTLRLGLFFAIGQQITQEPEHRAFYDVLLDRFSHEEIDSSVMQFQ